MSQYLKLPNSQYEAFRLIIKGIICTSLVCTFLLHNCAGQFKEIAELRRFPNELFSKIQKYGLSPGSLVAILRSGQ